jgi:hypothetical protein
MQTSANKYLDYQMTVILCNAYVELERKGLL